jgi:glutaredoxin
MPRVLLAAVMLLFATAVAAQTYRWVDKDGKVHYTQTPPPPAQATSVEKRSAGGSVVESGSQLPYATQQAAKNHPVTLYTAEVCVEACQNARALLSQRGVPFREVAVADEKARAALKKVSGGDEVPVLVIGKQVTKGYLAETWHSALDSAGYPRSGPPLAAKAQKPAAQAAAKAEAPEQAAAAPAPAPPAGRYAPPAPDAKEAKAQADAAARTSGRYAPPPVAVDPNAPAAPAQGPYAPK